MLAFIEKLRQLPHAHRKFVAVSFTALITGIIFTVWFISISTTGLPKVPGAGSKVEKAKNGPSPLETLQGNLKKLISGAKGQVEYIRDESGL